MSALTGSWLCGAVRFEVDAPFVGVSYCHCTNCKKISGTFVRPLAPWETLPDDGLERFEVRAPSAPEPTGSDGRRR